MRQRLGLRCAQSRHDTSRHIEPYRYKCLRRALAFLTRTRTLPVDIGPRYALSRQDRCALNRLVKMGWLDACVQSAGRPAGTMAFTHHPIPSGVSWSPQ